MRTIDSSISVLKPSNFAWWHSSWTGRFVLAALLMAAAAFALMPDRTSAHHAPDTNYATHCQEANGTVGDIATGVATPNMIQDCINLLTAASKLIEGTADNPEQTVQLDGRTGRSDAANVERRRCRQQWLGRSQS